jgi:hypothetical protein
MTLLSLFALVFCSCRRLVAAASCERCGSWLISPLVDVCIMWQLELVVRDVSYNVNK